VVRPWCEAGNDDAHNTRLSLQCQSEHNLTAEWADMYACDVARPVKIAAALFVVRPWCEAGSGAVGPSHFFSMPWKGSGLGIRPRNHR
jgi:hypothetical protein